MPSAAAESIAPLLSPHGQLLLAPDADSPPLSVDTAQRLTAAFALGSGHGLLHLGASEVGGVLPPTWAWWRDFAARYVTSLCATYPGQGLSLTAPCAVYIVSVYSFLWRRRKHGDQYRFY